MSTIPPIPFPLRSDSYKLTHWRQYPPGTTEVYSYLESRGGRFPQTVFFGLQPYLRSYLAGSVVTATDVDTADRLPPPPPPPPPALPLPPRRALAAQPH